MKALVTGAGGLIGAHLRHVLAERGWQVRALLRPGAQSGDRTTAFADIMQPGEALDAACEGCDVVFHTAAQFAYGVAAGRLRDLAVGGTANVLHTAARAGVRRVVVTSTSVVFGYGERAVARDESAGLASDLGESGYVAAKLAQHRMALQLGDQLGLDVRLACPTMTLGPTRAQLGPSNGLVLAYLADPFGCTWPGGCNLVAARDVALGHALIAEHGAAGEAYLLGAQDLSWREIHTAIAELAGIAPPRVELNRTGSLIAAAGEELRARLGGQAPLTTREQAHMVGRYYWYASDKAASLGYAPSPARAALVDAVSWLVASSHVSREMRTRLRLGAEIYRHRAAGGTG